MAACWPLQMPPTPKAVLISLADNANDQGECWPSIATIGKRTCFSERAVQNAIRWLEEQGYLVADRSNGRHTRYQVDPTPNPRSSCTPAAPAPPQDVHPYPRSSCTPTPAADAPHPRRRCVQPPQEVPSNRQEPSRARAFKARATADEAEPTTAPPTEPAPAAQACRLMRAAGCIQTNPGHVHLLAALAEGVTPQTLADTAAEAVAAGKTNPFIWAIATARGRHADGAKPIATTSTGATRHDRASDQPRESLVDRAASRAARIFAEHGFDTST